MLLRLHIRNYAIIEDLSIDFQGGFNIITGETGAGKSILMGALGLVLGNRADSEVLYDQSQKCFVEAVFAIKSQTEIAKLLSSHDLDMQEQLYIRREITASGKSRSFINDTPVTLAILRLFSVLLVDLHQQFDTLELGQSSFQREVVDAMANTGSLILQYREAYTTLMKTEKELFLLQQTQASAGKEWDYLHFLHNELEQENFKENEIEDIEAELALLNNAENIKLVLENVNYTLLQSEEALVQKLRQLVQQLQALKSIHPIITKLTERMQVAQVEVKDIAAELEDVNDKLSIDTKRLSEANNRLNSGYKLLKKHGVNDTNSLLRIQKDIGEKLQKIVTVEEEIELIKAKATEERKLATRLAAQLTSARAHVLSAFEHDVAKLLVQVGMPNARLKIDITAEVALQPFGADNIKFMFDANQSGRFEPLEKVASGGELSRLMLSIKSIVSRSMQMPTLIFDEIDTGISGEAARQAGKIMLQLAQHHQLIAITHQPQIAAKAQAHYYVFKKENNGQIKTQIRQLNMEERINSIAHMLSGENITPSTLQTAKEMVER